MLNFIKYVGKFCYSIKHSCFDVSSPPVNYVCYKMLLNENKSYLVLVAKQLISNDQLCVFYDGSLFISILLHNSEF